MALSTTLARSPLSHSGKPGSTPGGATKRKINFSVFFVLYTRQSTYAPYLVLAEFRANYQC